MLNSDTTAETFYRSNIIVPEKRELTWNDTLIDVSEFEAFLSHVFTAFHANPEREKLRVAINLGLSADDRSLEYRFLRLFTALESLVSYHREASGLATVLDESSGTQFDSDIRQFIRQHPLFKDFSERRGLIYSKLRDLNRIAFGTAFKETASELEKSGFDIGDLWPVSDRSEGTSLTDIRDRLVHGISFTQPEEFHGLFVAGNHLQWCVERMLLAYLGWPAGRSLASRGSLMRWVPYADWKTARASMSH
ncbi:MAG: hypothetical protein HYX73_02025 [Acidobacteria bacterium]|nr:hypothetical protein [Acidobacteriota bacterium]